MYVDRGGHALQNGTKRAHSWYFFLVMFACSHNFEWFTGVFGREIIGHRKTARAKDRSESPHLVRKHVFPWRYQMPSGTAAKTAL